MSSEDYLIARAGGIPANPNSQDALLGKLHYEQEKAAQSSSSSSSSSGVGGIVWLPIIVIGAVLTVVDKKQVTIMEAFVDAIGAPFNNIDVISAATIAGVAGKVISRRLIGKKTRPRIIANYCVAAALATASIYATASMRPNVKIDFERSIQKPMTMDTAMRDNIRAMYLTAKQNFQINYSVDVLDRFGKELITTPLLSGQQGTSLNVTEVAKSQFFVRHGRNYTLSQKANPEGSLNAKVSSDYHLEEISYFGGNEFDKYNKITFWYSTLYLAINRMHLPLHRIRITGYVELTDNGKFTPSIESVLIQNQNVHPDIKKCLSSPTETVLTRDAFKAFSSDTGVGRLLNSLSNNSDVQLNNIVCTRPVNGNAKVIFSVQRLIN